MKTKRKIRLKPRRCRADSVKTLEESYQAIHLLNDDGSYPELTPSVANYLPEQFRLPDIPRELEDGS